MEDIFYHYYQPAKLDISGIYFGKNCPLIYGMETIVQPPSYPMQPRVMQGNRKVAIAIPQELADAEPEFYDLSLHSYELRVTPTARGYYSRRLVPLVTPK